MSGTHGLHHAHYHLSRMAGIGPLFWAHAIRGIAANLVGLFIPIYLLQLGYSFSDVLQYLLLEGLAWLLLIYPMMRLLNRIGSTKLMAVSMVGNIAEFSLLATLPHYHWPLVLIAVMWGGYVAAYWPAMRASFTENLAHRRTGRVVGAWSAVSTLGTGLAPAIGGIGASLLGINNIYMLAIGMFIAAALPVYFDRHAARHKPFRWKDVRRVLRLENRDFLANWSDTAHDSAQSVIWPILIFLIVPTYAGIGLLSSVIMLTSMGIAVYIGRREETRGVRRYLRRGSLLAGLAHVGQIVVQNAAHIFSVNVISGLGYALYQTPFNTRYYDKTKRYGLPYLFLMQTAAAAGWVLFFLVLWLCSFFLSLKETLLLGVIVAIPASYGARLIR